MRYRQPVPVPKVRLGVFMAARQCLPRATAGRYGSWAAPPVQSGRRCRCDLATQCPGPHSWHCLRSRRPLAQQIGFNFSRCEMSELDGNLRQFHPRKGRCLAHHSNSCLENHGTTTHARQLRDSAFVCSRFAQRFAVQVGHLVAANDHRVRVKPCHRDRLGHGQSQCQLFRCLSGQRRFIHLGRHHAEGDVQPRQQGLAVHGRGAKNQLPDGVLV